MIETSNETAELFKALAAFQGAVGAPKKNASNPHFKSKFADLAEVLETAKAPLAANGLALVQMPNGECDGAVRITTMITHSSGQWLRASVSMPVAQKTAQAVGSAISYGRRYCAMAALGMAADDDDGESADGRGKAAKPGATAKSPQDRLDAIANEVRGGEPRPLAIASASTASEPAQTANAAETGPTIDELVTRYNMAAKAAAEFSNLSFTGECDDLGLMVPPGKVPTFSSGPENGKRYDDPGVIGKVHGVSKSENVPPIKSVWAAYVITRREIGKLLEGSDG